jgi:predicted dehydrogenase
MAKCKIALLSFAHMHAYSYADVLLQLPDAELVAIADDDPELLAQLRQRYASVPSFFENYRDLLREVPCDAVIIASENAKHCEMALESFRRGKHVLCEKPLATTLEDAKRMIEASRDANRILMTAFPVRFSPAIVEAKKCIQGGALGKILAIASSNHGSMPGGWFVDPRLSGGGAVMDHTVHVVDVLRWLFECEIAEVYAVYENRLHPEIPCEDVGLLSMRMENGAVVTLDTSWSRCKSYPIWGDVKLEIRGEGGRLSIDCFPQQMHVYDDRRMRHEAFALGDNLDQLMIQEFVNAIVEKREPCVTGTDGLRALEVALAAYRAGKERRPVPLTHD